MTLAAWRQLPPPRGRWRTRSRAAIRAVVAAEAPGDPDVYAPPEIWQAMHARLLAAVDAAYPFDGREHHPYKMWLAERRLFRETIAAQAAPVMPSHDEVDACEVARDMVLEGRLDEARAALEMAPNRLARKCPACGAPNGSPCFESRPMPGEYTSPFSGIDRSVAMLVPHVARLTGHRDAGPLFGGEP